MHLFQKCLPFFFEAVVVDSRPRLMSLAAGLAVMYADAASFEAHWVTDQDQPAVVEAEPFASASVVVVQFVKIAEAEFVLIGPLADVAVPPEVKAAAGVQYVFAVAEVDQQYLVDFAVGQFLCAAVDEFVVVAEPEPSFAVQQQPLLWPAASSYRCS